MIGRTPAHIHATRPLRHGVIADFEMTEQMLRHFIGRGVEGLGRRAHVIVCVPSGVTPVERSAVEEATLGAGAAKAFLIDEPLAAALGAELPVAESVGSLVVDVGGGTTEVGVTALGGLVVAHSIRVGGYELDEAIVRLLQERMKLLIGQEQAEQLKIEAGSATTGVEVPLTAEVAGRDLTTGLLRRASVSSDAIRVALARPLDLICRAVRDVLEQTPAELAADIAQSGLTLVGGGALLRGLNTLLAHETGLAVTIAPDPLTTVARGAGKALEQMEGMRPNVRR